MKLDLGAGAVSPEGYAGLFQYKCSRTTESNAQDRSFMEIRWLPEPRLLPRDRGVYGIKCTATDSLYIGASENMYIRAIDHRTRLRSGTSHNRFLQKAWNDFGDNSFLWAALQRGVSGSLFGLETEFIANLKTSFGAGGFNLETDSVLHIRDPETGNLLSSIMLGPSHPHRGKRFPSAAVLNMKAANHAHGALSGTYRGVNYDARTGSYMARIYASGRQTFLGRYRTEEEAAKAWNTAAQVYFGVGCYQNEIPCGVVPMRRTIRGRPKGVLR